MDQGIIAIISHYRHMYTLLGYLYHARVIVVRAWVLVPFRTIVRWFGLVGFPLVHLAAMHTALEYLVGLYH